jgi:HEAT repeat protein
VMHDESMKTNERIAGLINELGSKDGTQRERARGALVKIGKPAVPSLVGLLSAQGQRARWEACKALVSIKDPSAADPLVHALMDDSMEIRWLAAEALIALGRKALRSLFAALEVHFESVFLREGAHHVLHALERRDLLEKDGLAVLEALRCLEVEVPVAWAARRALDSLEKSSRKRSRGSSVVKEVSRREVS